MMIYKMVSVLHYAILSQSQWMPRESLDQSICIRHNDEILGSMVSH